MPIEFSGIGRTKVTAGVKVRATTLHSAEEVRFLLGPHPGLEPVADLRALGAPELVFARMLERRKNQIENLKRRATGRDIAARIAEDK